MFLRQREKQKLAWESSQSDYGEPWVIYLFEHNSVVRIVGKTKSV